MSTHADKTSENKSRAVANNLAKLQNTDESTLQSIDDNRPETIVQRKLHEAINNSPRVQQLRAYQEMANNSLQLKQAGAYPTKAVAITSQVAQRKGTTEEETFQGKVEPVQKKENKTGLPDNLKSGVESLSGMSMDNVKVHYNSSQPAQLNAHAYAQGSDIHIAPGQEQHLAHEAWHVVQQAQGRVKPTTQMKNDVPVNDDAGLEHEADIMGAKALEQATGQELALQKKTGSDTGVIRQNKIIQLAREYDTTLSPHKAKLMQWLVETNQTLGISQSGTSENATANKKSNFSWHHILAFADLSKHGEAKTAPANHGGNLRLGPMKNRFEASDVGGGTAIDYGYLPLDGSENIVLDAYSKGVFDGTITASDKSSLTGTGKLTSETHKSTPQASNFTEGKEAGVFGEWFLDSQIKNRLLSKSAIESKLDGVESKNKDPFIKKINNQFDSLLRTYKYYNKKKEVQITSGVPMTDISEGKFGHITVKKGVDGLIKASTVIDELLRDEEWVKRGSQGEILNEETTYKFGLASYGPFITLVENAAKDIDLTKYRDAKLLEFEAELKTVFSEFRGAGKQHDNFDADKETTLIAGLAANLKGGADTYEALWDAIEEAAVEEQYVKVKTSDSDEDWIFPEPEVDKRRSAITDTQTTTDDHSEAYVAWNKKFVDKLTDWDNTTPLFDEKTDPKEMMYIDFTDVGTSIDDNEQTWKIKDINSERQENSNRALPKDFLTKNMTEDNVKNAVANYLSKNRKDYLSEEKDDVELEEVKTELKNSISTHFNIFSKRLKGIDKDLVKRRTAFGADFEGFVNSTKWNVINSSKIPNNVEGTEGKKWAELGDELKGTFYEQWLTDSNVAGLIDGASTSVKLAKVLP